MKSLKFTNEELEFMRSQYVADVEQTEKYLRDLKVILGKIGMPEVPTADGQEAPVLLKTGRKQRSDKGVKRGPRNEK